MNYLPSPMWDDRDHQKREIGDLVMLHIASKQFGCPADKLRPIRKKLRAAIAVCLASADQLNAGLRDVGESEGEETQPA